MKFSAALGALVALSLSSTAVAHSGHGGRVQKQVNKRHAEYIARRQAQNAPPSLPTPPPGIPALSAIPSGTAPPTSTHTLFTSFAAGATGPVSGAPPLPTLPVFNAASYPAPDAIPPTNSPEVQEWLKELQGKTIPNIPVTTEAACDVDLEAAANAGPDKNCWWTCGGCSRATDITSCPDKLTWGVSFDDGPSDVTPQLVNNLNEKQLKATFFVVGSRVFYNPRTLQTEYMLGHQISIHTWSHTALTTLTNEQIVAELGWTRKIIKDTLGVSPNTFRCPYGDLDDRVRAVGMAMGLTPIQWTGHGNDEFDTDDWKIPSGKATGPESYGNFSRLLTLANTLDTGFIVLSHDLFQQEVDMNVGYFLPMAAAHNPPLTLEPIHQCLKTPLNNAYAETFVNGTTPVQGSSSSSSVSGSSTGSSATGSSTGTAKPSSTGASGSSGNKVVSTSSGSSASASPSAGTSGAAPSARVSFGVLAAAVAGLMGVGVLIV